MSKSTRLTVLLILLCLVTGSGLILAETEEADSLQPVIATSDSIISLFATAIAEQDSALLGSVLVEDVGVVMPGDKALKGRKQVMKYVPLLMEKVGGSELTVSRMQTDSVVRHTDVVREIGAYTLTKKTGDSISHEWKGHYTVYWRLLEDYWIMERIFISDR